MPWTRKLKAPILLKDGRRLDSPEQVADFIGRLPESQRAKPHWTQAAAILSAVGKGKTVTMADVQRQLELALKNEGLI